MKSFKKKFLTGAIVAAMLAAFILTGCATMRSASEAVRPERDYSEGYEAGSMLKEVPADEMAYEKSAATTAAAAPAGDTSGELYTDAGSSDAATSQTVSAKLIKNASIQVEVQKGSFEKALFAIASLAEQNNGYVSNSQSYSDSEGKMTSGTITIRVDKNNFDAVLNKIKEMGTVQNVTISVSDVTQEYVDNESRLKNLEAQRQSLLKLMDKSVTVKDSIEVQRELSNVEGQIEIIKGRQNYLDNLIAYSTIDVYISEPKAITDSTEGGFTGAVKRGARGALTALRVITMVLIAISPLLVIAGIILIIIWQSLRAKNRRRARMKAEQANQETRKN